MIREYYNDYRDLGLTVIPVQWDIEKKAPVSHRKWGDNTTHKLNNTHNALEIKTDGVYACLDFDLKNTERKSIFDEFKTIVLNQYPEIWDKIFIEQTRNKGYHVWIRYDKLEKKLALAESEIGNEVIALYAKGPLVYTFPTPGYSEYHNSMQDVQDLTQVEFEYLISTSQYFNEYKPTYDPNLRAVNYPEGYESLLSQFDRKIPNDTWDALLSGVGLRALSKQNKADKFTAFKRDGSASEDISAKVYYTNKRVLIFSASMHSFPNWHNRADYPTWSLPPSFVLFYKHGRDWGKAIEEVNGIVETIGIEIDQHIPTDYPLQVFPAEIANSIMDVCSQRSLSPSFVATAGLWTISSLAGTRYTSDFNGDSKNILFCLMVAPVSAGKTPAYKVMCETPLKAAHEHQDRVYSQEMAEWNEEKSLAEKGFNKKKPSRFIPITLDGTTESYINKSMVQPNGIGVYCDEAETILSAGNYKKNNDSVSFFTQAFSGGRFSQLRADETKERVVPNLNLNLLMGTQPDRLKNLFSEDQLASGFASRFLMIQSDYYELNVDADPFGSKKEMCEAWCEIVRGLFHGGMNYNNGEKDQIHIQMPERAKVVYRSYHKQLLTEANTRIKSKAEKYVIGTEAKMSAYFPRLCQILAIMHEPSAPVISEEIVHNGWVLYRYYAESTIKIISNLAGQIETGLPTDLELLYQTLPERFTSAEASDICVRLNLAPRRFEVSVRRQDFKKLFVRVDHGTYRKT